MNGIKEIVAHVLIEKHPELRWEVSDATLEKLVELCKAHLEPAELHEVQMEIALALDKSEQDVLDEIEQEPPEPVAADSLVSADDWDEPTPH